MKNLLRKLFYIVGMILVVLGSSQVDTVTAATDEWAAHGPDGGYVGSLAIDPDNPNILYAGLHFRGVFKSIDGGSSWTESNVGMENEVVYDLLIVHNSPTIIYAATSGGVFKSTNSGQSWVSVKIGSYVYSLVVDEFNGDVDGNHPIYAGTNDGVSVSVNGGESWKAYSEGLPAGTVIRSLAIEPIGESTRPTLYAATFGGIYKRVEGHNWILKTSGVSNVQCLTIDPSNPLVLYAGTYGDGIYQTNDRGENWDEMNAGLEMPTRRILSLAVDPTDPTIVFAGLDAYGVFKWDASEKLWNSASTNLFNPNVHALAIDPFTPAILYAGTLRAGVYKSTNSADSWFPANIGLKAATTNALATHPTQSSTVYAALDGNGVAKSDDGGEGWRPINQGLSNSDARTLAINPINPDTLYVGTRIDVFRSYDGGDNWQTLGLDKIITTLAINPTDPNIVYAGTENDNVHRSNNGGDTWNKSATGIGVHNHITVIAVDLDNSSIVYAGTTNGGLFKSTTSGDSWNALTNTMGHLLNIYDMVIDPTNTNNLYISVHAGANPELSRVYRSTDGGSTWTPASTGLTKNVISLAIHPENPAILYAAVDGLGVYKTTNRGGQWHPINAGLDTLVIRTLAINTVAPNILYAGSLHHGVYAILQDADSGTDFNIFLPLILR